LAPVKTIDTGGGIHCTSYKNLANLIKKLQTATIKGTDILISFDVISVFTQVPLKETLEFLEEQLKITILQIFIQTSMSTSFVFIRKFFDQNISLVI
jgi:hypothetical protein